MSEWAFWYLIKRHDALWRFVVKYSPLITACFNHDLKRHVRSFLVTAAQLDLTRVYGYSNFPKSPVVGHMPILFSLRRPIMDWMKNETLTIHPLGHDLGPAHVLRNIIKNITIRVRVLVLVFSSAYTTMFRQINNGHLASLTVRVYTCFDWKQDNPYDFVFAEVIQSPPPRAQRWLNKSKSLVLY
jgi:hypothetical protein